MAMGHELNEVTAAGAGHICTAPYAAGQPLSWSLSLTARMQSTSLHTNKRAAYLVRSALCQPTPATFPESVLCSMYTHLQLG